MLLERGMPKEAFAAFEATLKKEPNWLGATLGAGVSRKIRADAAKARQTLRPAAIALTENADLSQTADCASPSVRHVEARREPRGRLQGMEHSPTMRRLSVLESIWETGLALN